MDLHLLKAGLLCILSSLFALMLFLLDEQEKFTRYTNIVVVLFILGLLLMGLSAFLSL